MTKLYVFRTDLNGPRFTAEPNEDGRTVRITPQGGGFVHNVPNAVFAADFVVMSSPSPWMAASFSIDDMEEVFEGFTNGRRWNGWEVPYFTREVAERVMKTFGCDEFSLTWDGDTIVHTDSAYPDEAQRIEPQTIVVDGVSHTVWQVGDGWVWDKV